MNIGYSHSEEIKSFKGKNENDWFIEHPFHTAEGHI